ncbi:MAG: PD-(D/E)XK nuclease family protein [Lachnospiraceae bacterium]|nr:PD-(D/E)XK nuclease family protein [Candidatus Merdinaster equi]
MSLRFYLGRSGAGKSTKAYEDIIRSASENPDRNFFILVPDQYTMMTQKKMVNMHPDGGILNIDVLSFGRLAFRILEELDAKSLPILDDTGKNLIIRRIAALHIDEFPYIGEKLNRTGYIHEVKSVISEFMQYGVDEKKLDEMIEKSKVKGSLQNKLIELKKLYLYFMEALYEKYSTKEEIMMRLARLLPESSMIRGSEFLLDGFTGFTPVQEIVLQTLMELCKRVSVTITVDPVDNPYKVKGEQDLFNLSKKTIVSLCKLQEQSGINKEEDIVIGNEAEVGRYANNESLSFLEKNLFRYNKESYGAVPNGISIFHTDTIYEEVQFILRKIKKLIREDGYEYRNIAIVSGDLPTYADVIRGEAQIQGIPLYIDQNSGLLLNPLSEFIKSAIMLGIKGFSYQAVFHYLRSGLSNISMQETDLFEQYIRAIGIRGKKKYQGVFTLHTRKNAQDEESLEKINAIRAKFVEEIGALYPEKTPETVHDKVLCLYEFITKCGVQDKLLAMSDEFAEKKDVAREKEYKNVYKLVMQLLEQIENLMGDEVVSWKQFYEIFDAGLSELKAGSIPQNVDSVVCGDIERTRLDEIKVLFFAGVNDGNIPKGSSSGGIISDYDRDFLADNDFQLAPTPKQQMFIQRLYLYMLLTKPADEIILSYAHVDNEGKTIRPSYLINILKKMYPKMTEEKLGRNDETRLMGSYKDALRIFSPKLQPYIYGAYDDDKEGENELFALQQLLNDDITKDAVKILTLTAFADRQPPVLAMEVARVLYGNEMSGSVTRLEKYAACQYSYFLKYGLGLKEREEFEISSSDKGNVYHDILKLFSEKLVAEGLSWFDYTEDDAERILEDIMLAYVPKGSENAFYGTARNIYEIDKITTVIKKSISNLTYQIRQGNFVPHDFEMDFEVAVGLDNLSFARDKSVKMRGKIDRVDLYETEDRVYVRVIDYKSGDRDFDIVSVYHGLSLQLVIYMDAALKKQGAIHPDKEIVPSGILYYHVQDPMHKSDKAAMTDEEIDAKIRDAMLMKGLITDGAEGALLMDRKLKEVGTKSDVLSLKADKNGEIKDKKHLFERDKYDIISNYVNHMIGSIADSIESGNIDRNPYQYEDSDACKYCAYKSVCMFDESLGDEKRNLEKEDVDAILAKMNGDIS